MTNKWWKELLIRETKERGKMYVNRSRFDCI